MGGTSRSGELQGRAIRDPPHTPTHRRVAELVIVSWQHWVRRLERNLSVARSTRARYVNCHSAAGNSRTLVEAVCLKADLVGSLCYICCCCSGRVVVSGQLPPSHGRGCHSPQILSDAAANQADDQWDQPATWPVRGWPMGKYLPCSGWRLPSQPSTQPRPCTYGLETGRWEGALPWSPTRIQ